MKTRILQYAIQRDSKFDIEDVMTVLESDYGNERMFNRKQVEGYLDSFLGVGFLTASDLELDDEQHLHITYQVTEYGKSRGKYLMR